MIQMSMTYDDDARRSGKAVLTVYGVGTFPVLSGRQKFINNVNCSYVTDYGSIPVGDYWIVKMPSSGFANTVLRELKDLVNHTNHDEWFGLFSVRTMSDSVFVNGVKRGQFRLHPLRPDGSGESWGCITFFKVSDFQHVRRALLRTKMFKVPRSRNGLMAYGKVSVKGVPDFAKCNV